MVRYGDHRAGRSEPAADLAMAFEHHKAGRLGRAEAHYRRVLQKVPGNPDALHLLGVIALDRGRPDQAIQLINSALASQPDLAQAHSNLGNALLARGRTAEAIASYRRAIGLSPRFAAAYNNLGRALLDQGDFAGAVESCRRAVELDPGIADAHNNLGNALRGVGRLGPAEAALRQAVELAPHRSDLHANLGNVLLDLKRFEEAAVCHRRAIELDPKLLRGHFGLASALRPLGDMEGALETYRRALSLDAGQAVVWNALGSALRALGRFDEAIDAFRRAIAIDPNFADPYRNLAICSELAGDEQKIARVAALAAREDLPVEERVAAGFALGKAFDDSRRFDEAFAAYARANEVYNDALAVAGCRFDAEALRREIDETIARFTPELFASVGSWGNPSDLPVFIVGMPRSGTSLVEQIAASHSRVFGAGELSDIGHITDRVQSGGAAGPHPDWDAAEIRRLADSHLVRLRQLGGNAERVIDKNPDNIFKLGLVAVLFQSARVVFCRRDPRDIGLSCFFQKFSSRQAAFSYNLADCGRRCLATDTLIAHWHRALPLRSIDIHYEALIADLEGESRRLIAFLGLDWEPACLDFHRTERIVATASGWQVRQPLYDRSVGRWRNYERHLGPLLEALGNLEGLH
jgi:tetratricopeptide (TPR) repeat protein